MWKTILACAALVLSAAVFVDSIATAQAQQGVSFGQNPVFQGRAQDHQPLRCPT